MNEDIYWTLFCKTGRVEHYLLYRESAERRQRIEQESEERKRPSRLR